MNAYEELLKKYITICRQINYFKKKANSNCEIYFVKSYTHLMYCLTREPLLFCTFGI